MPRNDIHVPVEGRTTQQPADSLFLSTAKPLFDRVMSDTIQFDSIDTPDLIADNELLLMSIFVDRLVSKPPHKPNSDTLYSSRTLALVVPSLCSHLKAKFRDLRNLFPDEEIRKWKKKIGEGYQRITMSGTSDETIRDLFPIPIEHSWKTRIFPGNDLEDPTLRVAREKIDLLSLCRKLFQTQQFEELAKCVFTYKGIGRGGEAKFLSYHRMFFDYNNLNILFTQWFQRKTLKSCPSGFVPNFHEPESCAFFSLGCFWAMQNGLARPAGSQVPNTSLYRRAGFVFQKFHDIADANVAKNMNNIIRGLIPSQLKKFYTVKSFRIGAMTHLRHDTLVNYSESVALGGWTYASNADWYIWDYLVGIMAPILSLAGYPDPRVVPVLPDHTLLYNGVDEEHRITEDAFERLLSTLFPNNLPEFAGPFGRLHALMRTVCAVMIMHYEYVSQKYSNQHQFVRTMCYAVQICGIASSRSQASVRLTCWSQTLKAKFKKANVDEQRCKVGNVPTTDQFNSLNTNVAKMMSNISDMETQLMLAHQQILAQSNSISVLRTQINNLSEQNHHLLTAQNEMNNKMTQVIALLAGGTPLPVPTTGVSETSTHASAVTTDSAHDATIERPPSTPCVQTNTAQPVTQNRQQQNTLVQQTRVTILPSERRTEQPNDPPQQPNTGRAHSNVVHVYNQNTVPTQTERAAAVVTVAGALGRGRSASTAGTKGKTVHAENFATILKEMRRDPTNEPFRCLLNVGSSNLLDQFPWVHGRIFDFDKKAETKIKQTLVFIDAVWTAEDRRKVINRNELSDLDAHRHYEEICKKVLKVCYYLQKDAPRSLQVPGQWKCQVKGLANNITKTTVWKNLKEFQRDYVPDWDNGGSIKAPKNLLQLAEEQVPIIQSLVAQREAAARYNKGRGNGRGRGNR